MKQEGGPITEILTVALSLTCFLGFALNLYRVWELVEAPVTGMFVLRVVGIFVAPLGVVLGFIN